MATYTYMVVSTDSTGETIHTRQSAPWTHDSATRWAHVEGRNLPEGTTIAIDRRRGQGLYQAHRRYVVRDGVTRRTDR